MSESLAFGIVGCGEIAVQTAAGMSQAGNARVARVMDTREPLARDLGEKHGAAWSTRLEDMLEDPTVQAVYIAVPHYLHAEIAVKSAQAGKHILCEKPIATTLEDADRMIAAAKEAGVALGQPFFGLTSAANRRVKQWLEDEAIGRLTALQVTSVSAKPESYWHGGYSGRAQDDWRMSRAKAGGGYLLMNLIYEVNDLRAITGMKPVRVYAEWDAFNTPGVDVEDTISVTARYDNGAIGNWFAGSAVPGRGDQLPNGTRLIGTSGQIVLGKTLRIYVENDVPGLSAGQWHEVVVEEEPGNDRSRRIRPFAAAVLAGETPPVTGEDGREALAFVLAAYQSGEQRRVVELSAPPT
jgi:UDP-N-acetyl-2-amino-2-deoxyglucuronate dehydrogenase